jgi:hypothetical protein
MVAEDVLPQTLLVRNALASSRRVFMEMTGRAPKPAQLADTFADADVLRASERWATYFEDRYGIRTMTFPFALSDLAFFEWDELHPAVKAELTFHPQHKYHSWMVPDDPDLELGELYGHEFMWGAQWSSWGSNLHNVRFTTSAWRSTGNVWRCASATAQLTPEDRTADRHRPRLLCATHPSLSPTYPGSAANQVPPFPAHPRPSPLLQRASHVRRALVAAADPQKRDALTLPS